MNACSLCARVADTLRVPVFVPHRASLSFVLIAVYAAAALPASGAVIRVRAQGNDGGDGLTWATSKRTIAAGIAAAGSGGEVWVAAGTYVESVGLSDTSLYGGFAGTEISRAQRHIRANKTVFDSAAGPAVTVQAPATRATVIEGFCFTGGHGPGGILCEPTASPTISGNTFDGVTQSAISCSSSSPLIVNNVMVRSAYSQPVLLCFGDPTATPVVVNNTIVLNSGPGMYFSGPQPRIHNNIVAFNNGTGIDVSGGYISAGYNCVYANATDYRAPVVPPTDISADPLLPQAANGDAHLQANSPCRDSGDANAPYVTFWDVDGQLRPEGAAVDIGADESYGEHYSPVVIRVNAGGSGNGPGDSWPTAYRSLAQAVGRASPGCEIWVAKGTYSEPLTVKAGIAVYGGFAATETTRGERRPRLNATLLTSYVTIPKPALATTVLDGFTIRGSYTSVVTCGGSPLISGNVIESTSSGYPMGIMCEAGSAPVIANNFISRFQTGIRLDRSAARVVNNTIVRCTATTGAALAVSLAAEDPLPLIANNIIAFNASGLLVSGAPDVTLYNNCVFASGTNPYAGMTPGTTDISQDPILAGDFHIQPSSPCVNAGKSLADLGFADLAAGNDLDGQDRIYGIRPDIGADESYGETLQPAIIRVKYNSNADGPGTTWDNAYRHFMYAVPVAMPGSELWIAAGTYGGPVTVPSGVSMYGGFAGTETLRSQRAPQTNKTIVQAGSSSAFTFMADAGRATVVDGFVVKSTSGYGAIYAPGGSPTISGNVIDSALVGIGCANGGSPLIVNNCISRSTNYGISALSASPVIANNTLAWNGSQSSSAAIMVAGMAPSATIVANNIIAYTFSYGIRQQTVNPPTLSHNCLWENIYDYNWSAPPQVEVREDPKLIRMGAGDYHIQPDSPCRNAGDAEVAGVPATDMDGQARPQGHFVDIGADESYGESYLPFVVRVRADSPANGPGDSWATAYKTITAALTAALPGTEVWVTAGTYPESVTLKSGVAVYGGFTTACSSRQDRNWRANQTTITGSGVGCTTPAPDITVFDGFVVSGGVCQIVAGSPTISRNVFVGASGFAISVAPNSSPLISGNYLTGRQGGILCGSVLGARIVGNTITGNTYGTPLPGIALSVSSPLIANNVVAFNSQGIAAAGACDPDLVSNCVFGNSGGDYLSLSAGPSDVRTDPLLTDGLHLSPASPCVGASSGQYASLLPGTDIDGEPRQQGTAADIGADECWLWADEIAEARQSADGVAALLQGAAVTKAFEGFFYIEADSRACGLRVHRAGHQLEAGMRVDLSGTMATTDGGERFLSASLARQNGDGDVTALAMRTASALGADWRYTAVSGAGQRGVAYGVGLNPIGLYVRLQGIVTHTDTAGGTFTIWDGSFAGTTRIQAADGSSGILVRCYGELPEGLAVGRFLGVTGVISCSRAGESYFAEVLSHPESITLVDLPN